MFSFSTYKLFRGDLNGDAVGRGHLSHLSKFLVERYFERTIQSTYVFLSFTEYSLLVLILCK